MILRRKSEASRLRFLTAFLVLVTGCNRALPGDSDVISLPIGSYSNCADGVHSRDGNVFLNGAGFEAGAVFTLAQNGAATYLDQNGLTRSLSFAATSNTSATLAQTGQVFPGFSGLCVMGPGDEGSYPARMTLSDGALSYDAGALFVTLSGGMQVDAGPCGTESSPADYWILCEDGPHASGDSEGPVAQLPMGQYSCSAQVETFEHSNGVDNYVAGGGSGTLTLTQDGAEVTARYDGDKSLAGTLRLIATTSKTANAKAGQTLMAPCALPLGSQTPEALPVAAGALTVNDSTLFLSFAGTMAGSCAGAQVAASVICAR